MLYWHARLPRSFQYRLLEFFNHGYPIKHSQQHFISTLEIGAGLGEHIAQQSLTDRQRKAYVALELRENMAASIQKRFPDITTCITDCQARLPFLDNTFDRIIAIHVLEHLPNLPQALSEMHRVCHKEKGRLLVVIPCEGGYLYTLLRKITSARLFEKRYKTAYAPFIAREHCNLPCEIFEALEAYFTIENKRYYPFLIPSVDANILIGLTLIPR